jgi:hypothetical protein
MNQVLDDHVEPLPPAPTITVELENRELDLILEGLSHLAIAQHDLRQVADVEVLDAWLRFQRARQRRARLADSAGITDQEANRP